jgi:phosphoenolpyruvate carboxykinase (ATP)
MKLAYTRAIVDAIHAGTLADAPTETDPIFGLHAVTACPGVPPHILRPRDTWADPADYDATARKLAGLFRANYDRFASGAAPESVAG